MNSNLGLQVLQGRFHRCMRPSGPQAPPQSMFKTPSTLQGSKFQAPRPSSLHISRAQTESTHLHCPFRVHSEGSSPLPACSTSIAESTLKCPCIFQVLHSSKCPHTRLDRRPTFQGLFVHVSRFHTFVFRPDFSPPAW